MSKPKPAKGGFYDKRYSDEWRQLQDRVFGEVFDDYFGQSSLTTTADYDRAFGWLSAGPGKQVLDVACGGGAPTLRLATTFGCSVTGIDSNATAVGLAMRKATESGLSHIAKFVLQDASASLPFENGSFSAIVCIDALPHIANHQRAFLEWHRVLRPAGRVVFTDLILTGPISNEELSRRAASGPITVAPAGYAERCLAAAGFELSRREDLTAALESSSQRHVEARSRHAADLLNLEGDATFLALNRYRGVIAQLARERRLSHFAFVSTKQGQ